MSFFELETNFGLQIFRCLNFGGLPRALDGFFKLLDFADQVPALRPPLITGGLEVFFELLLKFLRVLQLFLVLRLDLFDELLCRRFGPGDSVKVDGFVFAFQLGASHPCAFKARGFRSIQ